MGTPVKIEDDLYSIIQEKLNILDFKIEYQSIQGFVNQAVYRLLIEKNLISFICINVSRIL